VKKLTILTLRSFGGPLLLTFLISIFVLLMQFLWKYIDDLVGKGLPGIVIFKLMVYVSVTLVPLALPLSILLSSIMTYGNLAEHFELTACKAAGISLQRVMRPLVALTILICFGAFFFSNNVLPVANLKMNALLYDVRQQKPALLIKEGVFYNGIDGYSIKVGSKDPDGSTLWNIMIYDHSENRGNSKIIMAEKGTMLMSDDERFLILTLKKGSSYEDQQNRKSPDSHPLMRTEFDDEVIRFDLSTFKMNRTDEQLFKDNYQMLNLRQLTSASDSIQKKVTERETELFKVFVPAFNLDSVSGKAATKDVPFKAKDFLDNFPPDKWAAIVNTAIYGSRNALAYAEDSRFDVENKEHNIAKHKIEWHRKFTLSFACLILFFIGAPLGAIIRKGGLGLPLVFSIIFFVVYHVISISSEKFAREGVIAPYQGMWISSLVLLPIGIFLTYKATTDSVLFDREVYLKIFRLFRVSKETDRI